MGWAQSRGGYPRVFRDTIDTTGRDWEIRQLTSHVKIRTEDFPVRVYFTKADFDLDANYVVASPPSASQPYGEWEGPVELKRLWFRGDGGDANVEVVAFLVRG